MTDVTVAQFAEVLKVPVDRLVHQLAQAGIAVKGPQDRIGDEAKLVLLTHLRRSHGAPAPAPGSAGSAALAAPPKITLQRKQQSELRLASTSGRQRTVNVEFRTKRTYVKRDLLQQQAKAQQDEADLRLKEIEEQSRAERERQESERREAERLEQENRRRIEEEALARRQAEEARRL
ncbi:MAG: translation initiation factor IF-2 associated domain-containing protein, partial [Steroidobacteraceae bacterium]|nr:translation initiation factor IF-2 associated domain-containing protein [Steroidobacteraceae bacterium]